MKVLNFSEENELAVSATPRSSMDSLSDNDHVVTNDFASEGYANSRKSSGGFDSTLSQNSSGESHISRRTKSRPHTFREKSKHVHIAPDNSPK
ncbi:hypothetical protein GCK32_013607 [Trichostrongylus colubriformis]|uniref:Uncharacterized protein n=1 Tax=Trichostrongylus colubriformis TaxID=6319 RepID=A0AAN8IHY2_TRICO